MTSVSHLPCNCAKHPTVCASMFLVDLLYIRVATGLMLKLCFGKWGNFPGRHVTLWCQREEKEQKQRERQCKRERERERRCNLASQLICAVLGEKPRRLDTHAHSLTSTAFLHARAFQTYMHASSISSITNNHAPLYNITLHRKGCVASLVFQALHTLDPKSIATSRLRAELDFLEFKVERQITTRNQLSRAQGS